MPNDDSRSPQAGTSAPDGFARPDGVQGSFAAPGGPRRAPGPSPAPRPSPEQARVFGRPAGIPDSFNQRHRPPQPPHRPAPPPPVPYAKAFSRPQGADDLQRRPGASPYQVQVRESPWWKPDAPRDPWRDPHASAVLVAPETDDEQQESADEGVVDTGDKKRRLRLGDLPLRIGALLLVGALFVALAAGATGFFLAKRASESALTKPDPDYNTVDNAKEPSSIGEIAAKVQPSVVKIEVVVGGSGGSGSGVVIEEDGYILTNNHVISAAADAPEAAITVYYVDGSASPAQIVGRDTASDLAVLKVDKPGLVPIDIGKSDNVKVGDEVVAFGSPLGLAGTVTSGIVSALNRPMHLGGEGSDTDAYILAVQTDASINPGNSGGALVDSQGALVGINSAIASFASAGGQAGSIGLGFAIPVDYAMSIATALISGEKPQHGSLGLSAESVTDGTNDGVRIVRVDPGSAAEKAGLAPKDIITEADGIKIGAVEDLLAVANLRKPGDVITVKVISGNTEKDVQVTLG